MPDATTRSYQPPAFLVWACHGCPACAADAESETMGRCLKRAGLRIRKFQPPPAACPLPPWPTTPKPENERG